MHPKENRRIVTRFDKLATSFAAMVSLACAIETPAGCRGFFINYLNQISTLKKTW